MMTEEHIRELLYITGSVSKSNLNTQIQHNKIHQKHKLGSFQSDVQLPYRHDEIDMLLYGLMEEEKEFEVLWKKKGSSVIPVIYLGPSGVGKTHQLFQHALRGFVCYFTAGDNPQEKDFCLKACLEKLKEIQDFKFEVDDIKIDESQTQEQQEEQRRKKLNKLRQDAAEKCLLVLSLSKLTALKHLCAVNQNFDPKMFVISQLNGSSNYYATVFRRCYEYCKGLNYDTLIDIHGVVAESFSEHGTKLGICFDEAQMFRNKYTELFFAAEMDNREAYTVPRDLLYAITGLVGDFPTYDYAAFAGTQLRLADAKDYMQNNSGRKSTIKLFTSFAFIRNEEEAMNFLRKTLRIDQSVKIPTHIIRKLFGRIRTAALVTQTMKYSKELTKEENLINAINAAFDSNFNIILTRFRKTESSLQQSKLIMNSLTTMLLVTKFDGSVVFHTKNVPDFVHAGVCHLVLDEKPGNMEEPELFFKFNEPLSIALSSGMIELLRLKGVKPQNEVVQQAIELLGKFIRNNAVNFHNENMFELLVFFSLMKQGAMAALLEHVPPISSNDNFDWIKKAEFKNYGWSNKLIYNKIEVDEKDEKKNVEENGKPYYKLKLETFGEQAQSNRHEQVDDDDDQVDDDDDQVDDDDDDDDDQDFMDHDQEEGDDKDLVDSNQKGVKEKELKSQIDYDLKFITEAVEQKDKQNIIIRPSTAFGPDGTAFWEEDGLNQMMVTVKCQQSKLDTKTTQKNRDRLFVLFQENDAKNRLSEYNNATENVKRRLYLSVVYPCASRIDDIRLVDIEQNDALIKLDRSNLCHLLGRDLVELLDMAKGYKFNEQWLNEYKSKFTDDELDQKRNRPSKGEERNRQSKGEKRNRQSKGEKRNSKQSKGEKTNKSSLDDGPELKKLKFTIENSEASASNSIQQLGGGSQSGASGQQQSEVQSYTVRINKRADEYVKVLVKSFQELVDGAKKLHSIAEDITLVDSDGDEIYAGNIAALFQLNVTDRKVFVKIAKQ